MKNSKSIGAVLCRFQPMHLGHLYLIKQALANNDVVTVFIGSANQLNERNPISAWLRGEYVRQVLYTLPKEDYERITLTLLDDLTDESDNTYAWGDYLYDAIRLSIKRRPDWKHMIDAPINIHYSDSPEIIKRWFKEGLDINVAHFDRDSIHGGISSTKLRKKISELGTSGDYTEDMPKVLLSKISELQAIFKTYEY